MVPAFVAARVDNSCRPGGGTDFQKGMFADPRTNFSGILHRHSVLPSTFEVLEILSRKVSDFGRCRRYISWDVGRIVVFRENVKLGTSTHFGKRIVKVWRI